MKGGDKIKFKKPKKPKKVFPSVDSEEYINEQINLETKHVVDEVLLGYTVVEDKIVSDGHFDTAHNVYLSDTIAKQLAKQKEELFKESILMGLSNEVKKNSDILSEESLKKSIDLINAQAAENKKPILDEFPKSKDKPSDAYFDYDAAVSGSVAIPASTVTKTVKKKLPLMYNLNVPYKAWMHGEKKVYAVGTVHEFEDKKWTVVDIEQNIETKAFKVTLKEFIEDSLSFENQDGTDFNIKHTVEGGFVAGSPIFKKKVVEYGDQDTGFFGMDTGKEHFVQDGVLQPVEEPPQGERAKLFAQLGK